MSEMPFSATVFNVLIASPSDVGERQAIAEALQEWNALNAKDMGNVLLPVMWESHSAPAMGDRPQGIINEQVVKSCDMLIGAFWTRLGSPTGVEDSGTVEEIKWFLKNSKPVMLYYSKAPVDVDNIDTVQLEKLKEFKKSIRDKGIQEHYGSINELKQKLSRQLTIIMRGLSLGPVVNAKVVREAKASSGDVAHPSQALYAPVAKPGEVWLEEYSEKSFVVRGETITKKQELKNLGGRYIPLRTGGKAWNFSKKRLDEVAAIFGIKPELRPTPAA
jgi:hypothetical protein